MTDKLNQESIVRKILQIAPMTNSDVITTTNISARRTVPLYHHSGNVDTFNKALDEAINEIRKQEDECLRRIFTEIREELVESFDDTLDGINKLSNKRIKPSKIIMNQKTYGNMLLSDVAKYSAFKIDIIVSDFCSDNEIIILGKPEHVGSILVRQDLTYLPVDDPAQRELGLIFFESIGMVVNPNSVVKMKVDTRTEEEKEKDRFKEKMKKVQRYRFISSKE